MLRILYVGKTTLHKTNAKQLTNLFKFANVFNFVKIKNLQQNISKWLGKFKIVNATIFFRIYKEFSSTRGRDKYKKIILLGRGFNSAGSKTRFHRCKRYYFVFFIGNKKYNKNTAEYTNSLKISN